MQLYIVIVDNTVILAFAMTSVKQSGQYSPRCTCWHPLLPTFSARIIFALRNLFGIACCAAFTLSPVTSKLIQGQVLLGLGFIVAIQSTLGATIQASSRLFLGGAIAAIYCLIIVNFLPRDIYFGVGATNIFVLLIVYTDLPAIVRRFSILPTCIILVQWFNKPYINTFYVLHVWASLSIGGTLAIISSCIPLPVLPTAYRELTSRMKFISRQIRREITGIVLLTSEYHNVHLSDDYDYNDKINQRKFASNTIDEDNIDISKPSYREDDSYNYSTSFENLKDDHLLKSDIEDLHSLVREEVKHMERALTEISFEPYFILLKLLNFIRNIFSNILFFKKFIKKQPSTLQSRLEIWTTSFTSLQRTLTGMLSLDHHHHAFVGQQELINAICLLIDSTFNFLDVTLPYTILSTSNINIEHIQSCREKVEEALEHFFETYAQLRENSNHSIMSNTDLIRLNTFLLLILRLVHVIITAAETSETPGTRLDINCEQTINLSIKTKLFNWKKICFNLANYIGLRPSFGKFVRAIKTSLSVLISAIVALTFRERLQASNWIYWAPMTTALVSDSSEGGTLRLSFHRLVAVLIGSTYAYIIILIAQNQLTIGIFICLFVALMGYIKTDTQKEYFAVVCGQSASIITFLSHQEGLQESRQAVLARTSLTFLGIFIHVFISNLLLPISARRLTKTKVLTMINNISVALKLACDNFCSFIEPTTNSILIDQQTTSSSSSNKTTFDFMNTLAETEKIVDSFPALLEEALNEPNFWKRPFVEVKDCYDGMSKTLRRIIRNIRFIHRCTTILKAETQLHFALEAKWQLRRASVISNNNTETKGHYSWTMAELRKQRQLQNDLDIPLTIFMTHSQHPSTEIEKQSLIPSSSSVSFRIANIKSYQPVLEHIRTLEKHIQQVILLTKQLIEKQITVDVGSFELQQLCHEDLSDEQQKDNNCQMKFSNDRSLFYSIIQYEFKSWSKNHHKCFSCCHKNQKKLHQSLPSLRNAVDLMLTSLIQFLHANNHFIRTELVSIQSIGDILAFHTVSYALKDMVEATTDLAKNARRIKHIDIRTLIRAERE
ncbi:unnamed protein product [Rotaria sordida]|uniref:Integral membrane bound transporter domain-containing protein n=1 Tax=Rotaria sordida TaxID=392033 RepID=A0A818VKN4_9BILA|nr:unnamed protein product [Rotaria sordida]CAF3713577.1 unnamed protein product [Rotaria sordida]